MPDISHAAASRPLTHLIVCREYPPAPYPAGGIGTYARQIAHLLTDAGEIVHVLAQRWEGAAQSLVASGCLTVHRIPLEEPVWPAEAAREERDILQALARSNCPAQVFSWQVARFVERLIEQEKIDVIEAQEWEAPLFYLQLRRGLGLGPQRQPPIIVHLHSPTAMIFEHNQWDKSLVDYLPLTQLEEFSIRAADSLICPSAYLAQGVTRLFHLEAACVTVVRYPMGETPVLTRTPETWARNAVCYVGRLELRKGVVEWVDAAVSVAETHPDVSFHFFGSDTSIDGGSSGESVLAYLKRRIPRPLRRKFKFYGTQSRKQLLLQLATFSIAVVPSRWENLPYTCIEAMATGLPVLVSPHGGMAELVVDGDSGWVACNGSSDGLAEALWRALVATPQERAAMGARASEMVRQACANEVVISRHLAHRSDLVQAAKQRLPMRSELCEQAARDGLGVFVTCADTPKQHRAGNSPRRRYSGMALIQNRSAGFALRWFLAAPLREKLRWIRRILLHPARLLAWLAWQIRHNAKKLLTKRNRADCKLLELIDKRGS